MFVGIDVGGTNLKAGLVDGEGRLLAAGTLRAHQAAWERLTRLLMERESVDGQDVARCLEA